MTDTEQLILAGISVIMRTQFCPNDEGRRTLHFEKLSRDARAWAEEYDRVTASQPLIETPEGREGDL